MMSKSVPGKILDRVICVSIHAFPFLELYAFFNPFLRYFKISNPSIEEAALMLRSFHWWQYIVFIILIACLVIKKVKLNYFRKYNLMQVLILIFLASFLDTADFLFPSVIRGQNSIVAPFFYFLCFTQLLLVIYCAIFAVMGRIPTVPFITRAIRLQIEEIS